MSSKMLKGSQLIYSYLKMDVSLLKMLIIFEYALGAILLLSNVEHYSHEECADEKKMN